MVIQSNNDVTSSTLARQKAHATGNNSNAVAKDTQANSPVDKQEVSLSAEAKSIERLEAKIAASEGTDTAKIDLIKQKIADGSYVINSEAIADGLIERDNLV